MSPDLSPPARTILTPQRKATFCHALAQSGAVRHAARFVGVSPQTAYRARRACRVFALAWDAALLSARARAEEVLADRALNGVEEAVYYHGEEVARRRRYDARLLLAHLARLDRLEERYAVNQAVQGFDGLLGRLARGETMAPDELEEDWIELEGEEAFDEGEEGGFAWEDAAAAAERGGEDGALCRELEGGEVLGAGGLGGEGLGGEGLGGEGLGAVQLARFPA